MIISWNSSQYGPLNDNLLCTDVWGVIQEEVRNGWFVPSKSEWAAFGARFNITTSDYSSKFGLSDYYWSSTQHERGVYSITFYDEYILNILVNSTNYVRLATTF